MSTYRSGRTGFYIPALALAALLACAGCAISPDRALIPPFRQGVTTAGRQATESLNDINAFFRQQQIERATTLPNLSEEDFLAGIDPRDIAGWEHAFSVMDIYAKAIESLLSDENRAGFEEELTGVATKANALADGQIPAELSAVFIRLAGRMLQIKGEQDALAILRTAEPAIQDVFSEMMAAIGDDRESGLRGSLWTAWAQILERINVNDFRASDSEREKRSAATRFVKALDERDAQDASLASIRLSLSSLAAAHTKMAEGRPVAAGDFIVIAQDEYRNFRKLAGDLESQKPGKGELP